MNKQTTYMYSTASEEVEARRLAGLNILHNPQSLRFLSPLLRGSKKILELGCGSGHLAADLLSQADSAIQYIGVDRDPGQVKHSITTLQAYPNARVIQLDIVNEIDRLRQEGPFDLIYCRWLLVHLPSSIRVQVIKNIFSLLSETGVFLCDECDNRSVRFKPIALVQDVEAPYEEATKLWAAISQGLMQRLGNDLELTAEKIQQDFIIASNGVGGANVEGQYQIVMRGIDQKRLITDGYRSSSKIVTEVCKMPFEQLIDTFDKCVADDSVEIEFLTENVVTYQIDSK